MVGEIISLASSLIPMIEGLFSNDAAGDTAAKIERQKLTVPPEMLKAVALAREQAYSNMPGYDTYKENIDELLPKVAGQAKEVSSSPSAVIGLMSKALGETNKAYQDLAIKNVGYHTSALNQYQDMLTRKSGMDLAVQQGNVNTNKEAIYQEAQGTKDLMSGINQGIGTGLNTYAMMKELGYDEEMSKWMHEYFKQTPKATPGVVGNSPFIESLDKQKADEPLGWLQSLYDFGK